MIDKNKRILITGATGFIGSNIVRKVVSEGFTDIHIFIRENSNYFRIEDILNKINVHNVNFLNEVEVSTTIDKIKPEIIFHLAAAGTTVGKDPVTIQELYNFNVLGTINLLNACKRNGFEFFINTGSSSEYGQKEAPMNENDVLEPNNDYGITKAAATLYCSYIGNKEELPIYTFRLFSVYGYCEERRRLIPTLILNYLNGQTANLSNPNSIRDYIFIDDVVNCYLNIDKIKGNFGSIFNIGSGKQYKISEVVEIIKSLLGSNINPNYGAVNSVQSEPLIWVSNNNKMVNTLKNNVTPLITGLEKTIQRFKINNDLYI